jgi:23S rRNA (guanosine2251-2'-O)-methyltransferase
LVYLSGFHAIEEKIKSDESDAVGPLLMAKAGPRAREIVNLAMKHKIPVNRTGSHELDRLAPDNRGIVLCVDDDSAGSPGFRGPATLEQFLAELEQRDDEHKDNALVIILDDITDPHNYGAILRSCDQFDVDLVLSRERRNAKHADVLARTSAGAVSWVPAVESANLTRSIDELKEAGFWVYGADMAGETVWTKDLRGRLALIMGGEAGLSRLLKERCDGLLAIPSKGRVDSLNVSVAAGVLMYEVLRQREA